MAGKQAAARTADKRASRRTPAALDVHVRGASGVYAGQTVDISRTGALLWITDESFVSEGDATNMVRFSERVAQELGATMVVEFAGGAVVAETEVVRVTRKKGADDKGPMLVACRFVEALTEVEWQVAGLQPARPQRGRSALPEAAPLLERREVEGGEFVERRKTPRVDRVLYVEVSGEYGVYKAYALNVSASGVLITLTDSQFAPPAEADQLVMFTKRLGFQFRDGMRVRFIESEVRIEADVVRVSERIEGGEFLIVIGAKFRRPLTADECQRLEIEPAPVVTIPATPKPQAAQLEHSEAATPASEMKTRILEYMESAVQIGASDLHIKVGSPARMRLAGQLMDVNADIIMPDESRAMARDLMTPVLTQRLVTDSDVEFAYSIESVGRFRICAFQQRGYTGLAIRMIPDHIPTVEELGISKVALKLAERPRGLVLVTGPTGSGKSHTLAAMLNHVNETRSCHILTMEDPIEFVHRDQRAHITQREIGRDCPNFAQALKRALRQDPDVILVGEMRDIETIGLALTAAETGHLVFATLHTTSASNTPDRIIDVFPSNQQGQVRQQLSDSLNGIISQILVPKIGGQTLTVVQEVLVATDAARSVIREGKSQQLHNIMQTSGKDGMMTLEQSLNILLDKGAITYETAVSKANVPKQIRIPQRRRPLRPA